MLPTSAGAEPATSWSPVRRCIQLSHRGLILQWGSSITSVCLGHWYYSEMSVSLECVRDMIPQWDVSITWMCQGHDTTVRWQYHFNVSGHDTTVRWQYHLTVSGIWYYSEMAVLLQCVMDIATTVRWQYHFSVTGTLYYSEMAVSLGCIRAMILQWDGSITSMSRPWWRSWMRVRLETRRSRVRAPLRSATFFRGDWSWNIFYGHSLPSADSRRAVVNFWWKNVHNTG